MYTLRQLQTYRRKEYRDLRGNTPIVFQSFEAALEKIAAQIPKAEEEDTFDGLADSVRQ